jgi:serine/threonine protein kinase
MNKYIIVEKLAKGTFGTIFKGQNRLTKEYVAIKVAQYENNEYNNLKFEAKLYQYINRFSAKGIPKLKWYGNSGQYNYLVTELLGEPLTSRIGKISFENALNIGVQIIERIQTLHSLGLIHRDIKPDNCLFGGNETNKNILYLIDFGLTKKYIDDETGLHIKPKLTNNHSIIGTPKYISLNIHKQSSPEPCRRDDIESCLYIIIELVVGKLSWDTNDIEKMYQIKNEITYNDYLPTFLKELIVYVRNLKFDEEPNYKYIIDTIRSQIR